MVHDAGILVTRVDCSCIVDLSPGKRHYMRARRAYASLI